MARYKFTSADCSAGGKKSCDGGEAHWTRCMLGYEAAITRHGRDAIHAKMKRKIIAGGGTWEKRTIAGGVIDAKA